MSDLTNNKLCFSIVSHGHGKLLHRLLEQLNSQIGLNGVKVIVTLNLLDEEFTAENYNKLDILVVRNAIQKGFGANHNAAFLLCDAPWFGILNPDLELLKDEPFTAMLEGLNASHGCSNVGLISPLVVNKDLITEDSVRENLTPWSIICRILGFRKRFSVDRQTQIDFPFFWVAGMCLLVRTEAYRAVGGFDERYFLYCEDYDFCARLYNAGWAIRIDNSVSIIHDAQRDSHRSLRHLRLHITSLLKVWLSLAFWRVLYSGLKK